MPRRTNPPTQVADVICIDTSPPRAEIITHTDAGCLPSRQAALAIAADIQRDLGGAHQSNYPPSGDVHATSASGSQAPTPSPGVGYRDRATHPGRDFEDNLAFDPGTKLLLRTLHTAPYSDFLAILKLQFSERGGPKTPKPQMNEINRYFFIN